MTLRALGSLLSSPRCDHYLATNTAPPLRHAWPPTRVPIHRLTAPWPSVGIRAVPATPEVQPTREMVTVAMYWTCNSLNRNRIHLFAFHLNQRI